VPTAYFIFCLGFAAFSPFTFHAPGIWHAICIPALCKLFESVIESPEVGQLRSAVQQFRDRRRNIPELGQRSITKTLKI
jgi:hypothetical protein